MAWSPSMSESSQWGSFVLELDWDMNVDEKQSTSAPISPSSVLSPLPGEMSVVDLSLSEAPLPPDLTCLTQKDLLVTEVKEEVKEEVKQNKIDDVREKLLEKLAKNKTSPVKRTKSAPDGLSPAELTRLERRRASNRRAAAKSRIKKKAANDVLAQELSKMEEQNRELVQEIQQLKSDLANMEAILRQHAATCHHFNPCLQ